MVSRRERRRLRRMNHESKDYNENSGNKDVSTRKESKTDSGQTSVKEVFDSSKYNAMSDMAKGESTDQFTDTQAMTDLQKKEPLEPEEIENKSIAAPTEASTASPEARVNPMMVEERARTIREMNEEVTRVQNNNADEKVQQEGKNVKVAEHEDYGYYEFIPNWMEIMMRYYTFLSPYAMFMFPRQYYEMANLGLEVYSQYLKIATDSMELRFKSWFDSLKQ